MNVQIEYPEFATATTTATDLDPGLDPDPDDSDSVYLSCPEEDVYVPVCKQSVIAVSPVIRSFIEECSGPRVIDCSDIGKQSTLAFVRMISSVHGAETGLYHTREIAENATLLLHPIHKFECNGLMNTVMAALDEFPYISAITLMDSMDSHSKSWMTRRMLSACVTYLQDTHQQKVPIWSDQLKSKLLDFILSAQFSIFCKTSNHCETWINKFSIVPNADDGSESQHRPIMHPCVHYQDRECYEFRYAQLP